MHNKLLKIMKNHGRAACKKGVVSQTGVLGAGRKHRPPVGGGKLPFFTLFLRNSAKNATLGIVFLPIVSFREKKVMEIGKDELFLRVGLGVPKTQCPM